MPQNTPVVPTAQDQPTFLAQLMPNRTRAKFLRFAAWFLIFIAIVFCAQLLGAIYAEIYARHNWPVAEAQVTNLQDKSDDERHVVPGSSSSRTVYWTEFEVEFAVPVAQCKTGASWGVPSHFPCIGTIHSLPRQSWAEAQDFARRHPLNSSTQIRYDPAGPRIKFADESLWDGYRWQNFVAFLIILALGLGMLRSVQRRLRYLETLPEDYDDSPPAPPDERNPNELIDLKLP